MSVRLGERCLNPVLILPEPASASVSRQLIADPNSTIISWTKYAKGVLVHFSEDQTSQPPSEVPWIALISCDTNGTNFSMVDDIFTLGRDRGAQAAVLYSLTSEVCLNPIALPFELFFSGAFGPWAKFAVVSRH